MTDKFSWDELEDDLAIKEQRAVAVYENPRGDTVIRQPADQSQSPDDDHIVIVNRNNLAAFVGALQRHLENQQQHDAAHPRNAR
jgi:hypothetical protein